MRPLLLWPVGLRWIAPLLAATSGYKTIWPALAEALCWPTFRVQGSGFRV